MLCTDIAMLQMVLGFPSKGGTQTGCTKTWVQLTATTAQQRHVEHPRKVTENDAPLQQSGITKEL